MQHCPQAAPYAFARLLLRFGVACALRATYMYTYRRVRRRARAAIWYSNPHPSFNWTHGVLVANLGWTHDITK
eukprot:COSAG02_NODE_4565_length_5213_cov_3.488268_6_plen_73_part_00